MYSLLLSDIFTSFGRVDHCFVLGDVTYGACCVDDFSASALSADLLIHYGHSCLVPVDFTSVPCLYVFVDIAIDVRRLVETARINLLNSAAPDRPEGAAIRNVVLAGTIQFASAIRAAKPELEKVGFRVLVPQSKPLSAGEVLGCTAPKVSRRSFGVSGSCGDGDDDDNEVVVVFVADGRFHLEAFMIANPGIKAFRYDPYIGSLLLEEYDHKGMKESRKNAILRAREARNWGIVLGTLGRQGNTKILDRLEKRMKENGLSWTVVLMSEITPGRVSLFEDSVDAWIQIACPRLSIDWGDAFAKPLLTSFEAEVALGFVTGWWERSVLLNSSCEDELNCAKGESCCVHKNRDVVSDYPMDYYAQDGGEWNSSYSKKLSRPTRRSIRSTMSNGAVS